MITGAGPGRHAVAGQHLRLHRGDPEGRLLRRARSASSIAAAVSFAVASVLLGFGRGETTGGRPIERPAEETARPADGTGTTPDDSPRPPTQEA